MRRSALALCALLSASLAAPAGAIDEDARLWLTATATLPLADQLSAALQLQPRFGDDVSELERMLVRPWLAWRFTPALAAAVGYDAHVVRWPASRLEQRVWQQLAVSHELAFVELEGRARLEQRIFEGADGTGLRLRMLLGVGVPLPRELTLGLRNEFFVTLVDVDRGPRSGFDEDRLFAGIGRALGRGVRVEGGYQMQWLNPPGENAVNHTAMLALSWDLSSLLE